MNAKPPYQLVANRRVESDTPTAADCSPAASWWRSVEPVGHHTATGIPDHEWLPVTTGGSLCARCLRRQYRIEPMPPCGALVRDGYWTVKCEDGCHGTGRYAQPNLPDLGEECRACKGTGYKIVALAKPLTGGSTETADREPHSTAHYTPVEDA